MRSVSKIRKYIACMLVVMLLMSSGLEVIPGAIVSAMSEETIVETDKPTEVEATTPAPTEAPTSAPTEVPTPVPTEVPTLAPTEAPTAVPTEEPTQEPAVEETAIPKTTEAAATEVPTPEPVPAETPTLTDAPTIEPTEIPSENLHFSEGYVRLGKDSIVYEEAKETEELGTLKAKGIVYAELAEEASDPAEDWLKITFDTPALRESNADFAVGYVQYKMVEALTDEEAEELIEELEKDEDSRWEKDGKFYVPCVVFEEKKAIPETTDAPKASDLTPEDETPSESSGTAEAERIGRTTANNVNVRSEASTQSERVTTIAEVGTEVVVTGETETDGAVWYAISYEGYVGYIRSDLMEIVTENVAAAYTMLSPLSDTSMEGSTVSEVMSVWYDKGIEGQALNIHVTTNLEAQYLYLYQGEGLLGSWSADEASIDEYATCKEWHVSYTFANSGAYYLWYRASADGETMSGAYSPDPVEIERPAVINVWYERGYENEPLKIHATTNLKMQYLYLYQGETLLDSWSADEAEIEEYATCKDWIVEYTFAEPGAYYLWYKASADGETDELPYSPDPVEIERPAVINVWYERGYENKPLKIHATTNLKMQYLYLYQGEELLGSWSADEAEIEEYATCKDWIVEYTFAEPGAYYLWYKASADGETDELPYSPDPVEIERPAVINVWYERGYENEPLKIHATTNLKMQYLYLYQGETLLDSWSADEAEIEEYATCKDWIVEYTFAEPGAYYLWYKASADGVTDELPYSPDPVEIERPAVINVWYEDAKAGTPLKIHVTTNLAMQNLYLYLGEEQLGSWSAEGAEVEVYETCKDWTVEYTFMGAGTYYLWYKASKDGETDELPYAPDPVNIGEAGDELAAPVWESIAQEDLTAVLSWQAVDGADGYEVSMSEGESDEYSVIGETEGETTLTTGTLTAGTTYAFKVRAYALVKGEKVYSSLFSDVRSLSIEGQPLIFGDFTYTLNEDGTGVVITSYFGSEADVVVPETIEGIPVTEIGDDAFLNNATLTKITLPQTVERIGSRAFKNCTALSDMN